MRIALNLLLALTGLLLFSPHHAHAVVITKAKQVNLLQTNTESPYFTQNQTGAVNFLPSQAGDANSTISWTPAGTVQAGQITTLTTNGSFNISGTSTSAGADLTAGTADDWLDGNGVPAGITLNFNAQITFSVGVGSPTGSWLTIPSQLGGGIGITQVQGGTSTIDSLNLNEVPAGDPNDTHESLDVTAVTVSGVSFSGTLAEAGFSLSGGTVGSFGPRVIRGNSFTESAEFLELRPSPTSPATIGFGQSTGSVASNVAIENSFNAAGTSFPRQIGAYTLAPTNSTLGLKGVVYEYDVTYDISTATPAQDADFNNDNIVDGNDFLIWQRNLGAGSATNAEGDADGNATVDAADLAAWKNTFGTAGSTAAVAAVPEPAGAAFAAFLLAAGIANRKRS